MCVFYNNVNSSVASRGQSAPWQQVCLFQQLCVTMWIFKANMLQNHVQLHINILYCYWFSVPFLFLFCRSRRWISTVTGFAYSTNYRWMISKQWALAFCWTENIMKKTSCNIHNHCFKRERLYSSSHSLTDVKKIICNVFSAANNTTILCLVSSWE